MFKARALLFLLLAAGATLFACAQSAPAPVDARGDTATANDDDGPEEEGTEAATADEIREPETAPTAAPPVAPPAESSTAKAAPKRDGPNIASGIATTMKHPIQGHLPESKKIEPPAKQEPKPASAKSEGER